MEPVVNEDDQSKGTLLVEEEVTTVPEEPIADEGQLERASFVGLATVNCATVNEIEVTEPYRSRIEKLIEGYTTKKNVQTSVQTKITLRDEVPVSLRPRRLAPKERDILNDQINEWLSEDIIRPSKSEYASPIVIVRKKDGSSRICVDYRLLNRKIIRDRYLMPLIDDKIDALVIYSQEHFRVFSVIDLKNSFFHVPVEAGSVKYTAFVTPNSQYEFLKTIWTM